MFIPNQINNLLLLILNHLLHANSETSVKFRFKFYERLLEIIYAVFKKLNSPLPLNIIEIIKTLFVNFKKFKNHKLKKMFDLKSSILLINLGLYDVNYIHLLSNIINKKYKKECLTIANQILSLDFDQNIKSQLAFNEKFYDTLLGVLLKEKGKLD